MSTSSRSAKVFWGGPGAAAYPLHRDSVDADVFSTVLKGCKSFIIVAPEERGLLSRLEWPGFHFWHDDLFGSGKPRAMKRGWKGTVEEGETLYVPGEMLHEARVECFDTISVSRRPWKATAVRDIGKEVEEIWREVETERVEERSWMYGGIEKARRYSKLYHYVSSGGLERLSRDLNRR